MVCVEYIAGYMVVLFLGSVFQASTLIPYWLQYLLVPPTNSKLPSWSPQLFAMLILATLAGMAQNLSVVFICIYLWP